MAALTSCTVGLYLLAHVTAMEKIKTFTQQLNSISISNYLRGTEANLPQAGHYCLSSGTDWNTEKCTILETLKLRQVIQ